MPNRAPYYYGKKTNNRSKKQSPVLLKSVLKELEGNGYEVIPAEKRIKKTQTKFALAWFKSTYPEASYSRSGRTVQMGLVSDDGEHYDNVISLPVSEGHLSRDAVRNLRNITGLPLLDPQAAGKAQSEAYVPSLGDSDNFDWDNDDWDDDDDDEVCYIPAEKPILRP